MIVNLGAPYVAKLNKIIERGYAGNKTEAMRQAITSYCRELDDEENRLVGLAVADEMEKIKSGKSKLYTFEQVKKHLGLKDEDLG